MPISPFRRAAWAVGLCAAVATVSASCSSSQASAAPEPAPSSPAPATAPAPAPQPARTAPRAAEAPTSAVPLELTSESGVYTAEQANYGKNVFMGACVSCHSPGDYQGGAFYAGLIGTKVGKLFKYIRENMPQDNPGALADEDYVAAVAYILQLNRAPSGTKPLPADTAALAKITFVAPSTPPHHFSTGR